MRGRRLLTGLSALAILCAGCETLDNTKEIMEKPRGLLDKATPTESARARRIGLKPGEPINFVTELDGQRRSTGTRIRKETTFADQPAELLETRQVFDLVSRDGQRIEQIVTRKVITAAKSGVALYSAETVESGGQETKTSITIVDGLAKIDEAGPDGTKNSTVNVPPETLFSINPIWILNKKPDIGDRYEAVVLDASERKLAKETATIRDYKNVDVLGTEMKIWEVEVEREGSKPVRLAFTAGGDIVRQQADNLVSYLVTSEVAERDEVKMEIINSLPLNFPLPAWDNFNVIATKPQPLARWKEFLHDSEYLQVQGEEVLLKKYAPRVGPANFPVKAPESMKQYLQAAEGVTPEDGEVQDLAKEIIGDEKRVLQTVALLAGWVYQKVAFERGKGANKSARDTIRQRSGDQVAHADLFASLARSLGLPTRHCCGLLLQRDNAIYHTWVEVWVEGVWVPVDTTVNRVGLPAGYLLTARGDGMGMPRDQFAWALRDGGLGMEIISATKTHEVPGTSKKEDFTLFPGQKKTYVAVAGDWLANIYWGFSVFKPTPWLGNIGLNHVTISSPDESAQVKLEALNQVLPCTDTQLDMVSSSLEKSLPGFKKFNQGRVLFGNRHDPALFIDFSVAQDDGTRRRCQMYIIPKRGRSYRVTAWSPADHFENRLPEFKQILDTVSL